MSISKFQELVKINTEDHKKTTEYVKRNHDFIQKFTEKLADSLGCSTTKELLLIDSKGKTDFVYNNVGDFITIKNDCFFEFQLLLKLVESVNLNVYGQSFLENDLVPLSGVILVIAVKQHENLFIVKPPALEKEQIIAKEFPIDPNNDNTWIEILDSCYEAIKKTVEVGLEKRISELKIQSDDASKKVIGYITGLKNS